MKQLLNNIQVALVATLLVSLPALVFWATGAFDSPPSQAFNSRTLPRHVHAGPAAQRPVPTWQYHTEHLPSGMPRTRHHGGHLAGR